jgi:S-phase kinase-associated protein 1
MHDLHQLQRKCTVTLESCDGKSFSLLHPQETSSSKLIQHAIEDEHREVLDQGHSNSTDSIVISIVKIPSNILEYVVVFLKHYAKEPLNSIEPPLGTSFDSKITQDFYRNFINGKTMDEVFQLVHAANYMDIPSLLNLTCLKVGFDLMGKSAEEIRILLKLSKLSSQEEIRAKEEHPWLFEES